MNDTEGVAVVAANDKTRRSAIRVLAVDDHPLIRMGVRAMLDNEDDVEVVGDASNGADAVLLFAQLRPDVVLMDLRMPGTGGLEAMREILRIDPAANIVAVSSFGGDGDIMRALQAGARGYLLKDTLGTELVAAVRAAAAGQRVIPPEVAARMAEFVPRQDLTPREIEVLTFVAKGLANREIARAIGRTTETVKAHLKNVMAKLGVGDRTEAVMQAVRRGIIHVE
jgi:DNA-binding NarL/FixJ family response regulator